MVTSRRPSSRIRRAAGLTRPFRSPLFSRANMREALARTASIAVMVFAVSSMLSVGLAYTIRQIPSPLREARAIFPRWAVRLLPIGGKVSTVAVVLVMVATFGANVHELVTIVKSGTIVAGVLLVLAAFVTGF